SEMERALRGFYEFHECLVEPWDGPAALAFSDGVIAGSALDRNGLRPCRYKITRDGLVVAGSEVGLVDLAPSDVIETGSLGPGELLVVDTRRKAILHNVEAKREVARRRPYARWAARCIRPLRPVSGAAAPPLERSELGTRQLAFGWSFEDLRYVVEPMGGAAHPAGDLAPGGRGGRGGPPRRARPPVPRRRARCRGGRSHPHPERPHRRARPPTHPDAARRRRGAPAPRPERAAHAARPRGRSGR